MKDNRTQGLSTANQRAYILSYLEQNGSATTLDFRNAGIMAPAPRIKELREEGHIITTFFETVTDHVGVKHGKVARYFLQEGEK